MTKLYLFAAVFLFWTAFAASLMQVQLGVSSVHRMRVPTYRSVAVRATMVAQAHAAAPTAVYN